MIPHVDESVSLQQAASQHDLSDLAEATSRVSCSRAIRLSYPGGTLICMIFTWTRLADWTHDAGRSSALVKDVGVDSSSGPSSALLAKPLRCCARGSGGKPGICLPGDPNGICCGSELALLCGAGSLCYTNAQGRPFCCGKHTSGCAHVCLDNFTRDNFISKGGVCNPISPQGFNADGTTLYVEAPWDGYRMGYQVDGTENITFVEPPIQLGAGDFTMTATLMPRNDSEFGTVDEFNRQNAVLFRRIASSSNLELTGFQLDLRQNPFLKGNFLTMSLFRSATLSDELRRLQGGMGSRQFVAFNLSVPILANVAISLRVIRQGLNLTAFVNNAMADVVRDPDDDLDGPLTQPIDVDTDLNAPLQVNPSSPLDPRRRNQNAFIGLLRDLSITGAAEFPSNFTSRGVVRPPVPPPISPHGPGLNVDGTTLIIPAPFDTYHMCYQVYRAFTIAFVDPPIQLGTGDFTMTATLIPRDDGVFGIADIPNMQIAVVFRRIESTPEGVSTGFEMSLREDQSFGATVLNMRLFQRHQVEDRRLQEEMGRGQFWFWNLGVPILANVSISLTVIRRGVNLTAFINNMPANLLQGPDLKQPINVDTDDSVPLEINPTTDEVDSQRRIAVGVLGCLRDLSITSAAEL